MKCFILILLNLLILSCGPSSDKSSVFNFEEGEQGIALSENGKAVFFYQKEPKEISQGYVCNNYLHPLYSLNGDTLTEEAPEDHPHHRGIFWSWHQHYINGRSIGDGWMMDGISKEVVELKVNTHKNRANLDVKIHWKSTDYENGMPYLEEHTSIVVHPLDNSIRMIDFTISLQALLPGVSIRMIDFTISLQALLPGVSLGGSDDEKGYGGFCTRIKMPDDFVFTSIGGPVKPQNLQVSAGPWMHFSGSPGTSGEQYGLAILCHPGTPNYPAPWILRQKSSMQNIVFPGRDPVEISMDRPVILKYRLILHAGTANDVDLAALQSEYSNTAL
jgi:hypothetical protein